MGRFRLSCIIWIYTVCKGIYSEQHTAEKAFPLSYLSQGNKVQNRGLVLHLNMLIVGQIRLLRSSAWDLPCFLIHYIIFSFWLKM